VFKITREQPRQIVKQCRSCVTILPVPHLGINQKGLIPNSLWLTHYNEFGNQKYIHVCVDTYSDFIYATLQTGEASKQLIIHMLATITVLGVPKQVKTDNDPGYTSSSFHQFCEKLGTLHETGIPYNPQGRVMVKRTHQTNKHQFEKIKTENDSLPRNPLEIFFITHSLF
jgi:transposase InsO family protein